MPTYATLILIFSGIGVLDTLYLSYHAFTKTPVVCYFFPDEWCKKVQYSPQSKTFGIPNAFAGLAMYVTILALLLLFLRGVIPFWPITAIVTFGFLFSLYFTYVQAFVLKAFCTWCVLSVINFLVLFLSVYVLRG